ncbi:methylthioribose-1-phosphate isomerase [Achromatium sp. WMS1]|nr:methylthioribose-1-phosphate isomerase [Achromatium sp. WMS1]
MSKSKQTVESIRWCNNQLEMIDQRILPAKFKYISYKSAIAVAEGIRSMVVRGAPAIGCAAAYGVALEALRLTAAKTVTENFTQTLQQAFTVLQSSRPTAVNLAWALKRMQKVWEKIADHPHDKIAEQLLIEAHTILAEDIKINKAIGAYGAALLLDGAKVLTHCNAGALATAGHGTALGIFRSAVETGKHIQVFADETRPFLQGARLTVWEMMQENIPVTLITDNMAGYMMSCGEVHTVIVGTDRVAANGDVANKIGTYMVAVLAKRHNIPFYVACPLSSIDFDIPDGHAIPIEERPASEVTGFRDCQWATPGVTVRNPAFDITPADLVTGLITEKGVIHYPTKDKIAELLQFRDPLSCS